MLRCILAVVMVVLWLFVLELVGFAGRWRVLLVVFRLIVWCFIVNMIGCLGSVIFLGYSVLAFCVGLVGVCGGVLVLRWLGSSVTWLFVLVWRFALGLWFVVCVCLCWFGLGWFILLIWLYGCVVLLLCWFVGLVFVVLLYCCGLCGCCVGCDAVLVMGVVCWFGNAGCFGVVLVLALLVLVRSVFSVVLFLCLIL